MSTDSTVLTGEQTPPESTDGEQPSADVPAETPDGEATGDESADESGKPDDSLETYADFTLPEGVELDSTMLDAATPVFKELGLTQEQAQKLVDLQVKQVEASQQGQVEAFNQLKNDWLTQAKADKEIGGEGFDQNVADARVAMDKFGGEGLTKLMNELGIGNHPEIIRFMANVGRLTKEDVPDNGDPPQSVPKDRVGILYPNT